MKKLRCKKRFKYRYMEFGIVVLFAVSYIITSKRFFYSQLKYNIFFITIGILLGVFYCLRGWTLCLQERKDELFFWDGLVDIRHIKYNDIAKIEYNPEIRVRFYIRDKKKTKFSIPNVFEESELIELLESITKKRKWIKLEFIGKEKIIDTSQKIVRSKPIKRKADNK